jgi:hypothetical protein
MDAKSDTMKQERVAGWTARCLGHDRSASQAVDVNAKAGVRLRLAIDVTPLGYR